MLQPELRPYECEEGGKTSVTAHIWDSEESTWERSPGDTSVRSYSWHPFRGHQDARWRWCCPNSAGLSTPCHSFQSHVNTASKQHGMLCPLNTSPAELGRWMGPFMLSNSSQKSVAQEILVFIFLFPFSPPVFSELLWKEKCQHLNIWLT